MIEIRRIDVLSEIEKDEVTSAFVECFYDVLFKHFGTKQESIELFKHFIMFDTFIGAFEQNKLVGFISVITNGQRAIKLDLNLMKKSLGWIKASIMYPMVSEELQGRKELASRVSYIEYLGTLPSARGKGVASQLIESVVETNDIMGIELDVHDTNNTAISLYKKLGFEEVSREVEKNKKKNGANYKIRMLKKTSN